MDERESLGIIHIISLANQTTPVYPAKIKKPRLRFKSKVRGVRFVVLMGLDTFQRSIFW